jgi:hypothetical protein
MAATTTTTTTDTSSEDEGVRQTNEGGEAPGDEGGEAPEDEGGQGQGVYQRGPAKLPATPLAHNRLVIQPMVKK